MLLATHNNPKNLRIEWSTYWRDGKSNSLLDLKNASSILIYAASFSNVQIFYSNFFVTFFYFFVFSAGSQYAIFSRRKITPKPCGKIVSKSRDFTTPKWFTLRDFLAQIFSTRTTDIPEHPLFLQKNNKFINIQHC